MSSLAVPGVRVGHWTGATTGVTVVLAPEGTVGSGEVRGGAPATRETALLDPTRMVTRVDAVVLTGGSAFGLAAADGVMRFLAERGQGFPTNGGPVPIVPAAAIYDLQPTGPGPPGAEEGYAAARAALADEPLTRGRVGAGRGATVGKWRGRTYGAAGGVGIATAPSEGAHVAVLAVVNAAGDVVGPDGQVLAGSSAPPDAPAFPSDRPFEEPNTTLVVVATSARLDKLACHLVAQTAHDGLARALHPAHSRGDGDLTIALATGTHEADPDRLRVVAADLVAAAIRDAVASG